MKILESDKKILNQLEAKKSRLENIANSDYPVDPSLNKSHERRVQNAKAFLDELEEVLTLVDVGLNIKLVPRPTFEKQVERADFATLEFEGEYCKVALIQNYPYDNLWLIHTAPVESI